MTISRPFPFWSRLPMWPHVINNIKFLGRWGRILKVTWISNEWSLMLDLFALNGIFFFFMDILDESFAIFWGDFLQKFTSSWLLEIVTFYLHFLLKRQFPTFFSCSFLSILEALCSYSHFAKQYLNLPIWSGDLPYENFPFFGRKAFLPLLIEIETLLHPEVPEVSSWSSLTE